MRNITSIVTNAFINKVRKTVSNTMTDGSALFLHGNKIAEWRAGELWISNAGWFSATTKERLNGLPGVSIYQRTGEWFLNGHPWDGSWIKV